MKKSIFCICAAAFGLFAQERYVHPESVALGKKAVFVTNIGKELKPSEKDGDGFISKLNYRGEIKVERFIDGLNAPKGTVVVGDKLWTADVDALKGFSIKNGKSIGKVSFEGESLFVNGLTVKDQNTLFMSATDSGALYEIDLKNLTKKKLEVDAILGANGLWYDEASKRMYVCGFGEGPGKTKGSLGYIRLDKKPLVFTKLEGIEGYLDGLVKVGDTLYVSDWVAYANEGVVRTYDLKSGKTATLEIAKVGGPADFKIDVKRNTLWLPVMLENRVQKVPLSLGGSCSGKGSAR